MPPALKRLTSTDVARIIDEDDGFKEQLLARMCHTSGVPLDVLRPALHGAIDKLKEAQKRDSVTYRLSCKSCGIDRLIETVDWENSGVALNCCVCSSSGTFKFPKDELLITCATCGVESWIRRVKPSV